MPTAVGVNLPLVLFCFLNQYSGKTATQPILHFETNDIGIIQALRMFRLPSFLRRLYVLYIRYIRRDEIYAGLVEGWYEKRITEYWPAVAQREAYKARWFEYMQQEELDFILTVPNALPAVPHNGMKEGWRACGYAFLFNLVGNFLPCISCLLLFKSARLLCWSIAHHARRCCPG